MSEHFLQFQREKTALKFFLLGREYHQALKALGFVERYNIGLRKDGVTPNLHHEVRIAMCITQLKDVSLEELCIIVALLHDVQEDHQIPTEILRDEFGLQVSEINWKMTKKFAGTVKDKKDYIEMIALDSVASIDKGIDRCDNLEHMVGVFSIDKMEQYAEEAETLFLSMLKKAEKLFPEQQAAYHAISQRMKTAIKVAKNYVKLARDQSSELQQIRKNGNDVFQRVSIAEDQLRQLYALIECDPSFEGVEKKLKELKEVSCSTKQNKEAYKKALTAVLHTCKYVNLPIREQVLGIKEIADQLRIDFGISNLELTEFSPLTTGPIPSP